MIIYLFDNTFEGLLTSVFDAYSRRIFPDVLLAEGEPLPLFYDESFTVISDEEKSGRVWRGLEKKLSSSALSCLAQCWLAEEPETASLLFRYIHKAIDATRSIETNFADPDVLEFSRMWKRVDWERIRMLQFIRFQKAADGTYFAAVEPEKRMYPLALGAGVSEEGFVLKYAMPDMNVTTGQEKPEEDPVSVLTLAGENFHEIEKVYNRSQEKFLDLGHLQVVILDESMMTEENRKIFLEYLKQEKHVGEDVYMFRTGMLGEVFRWKGAEESSVGEYLQGIQENRTTGQQKKGVTLREVYHQFYQDGTLPWIPSVWVNGDLLEVNYGNRE